MTEWAFRKFGSQYILVMMLVTRVIGSAGGLLVIYYVNLTTSLPAELRWHFERAGMVVVAVTVAATVLLALWETRTLRRVLAQLIRGQEVNPSAARQAGRTAVLFAGRHHLLESMLDPALSALPLCIWLWLVADAPLYVLVQVMIAAFIGISAVLLATYFASERWMAPVTRYLLDRGIAIDFEDFPTRRLQARMNVCFSLIIMVTALMIGGLANQRAMDLIRTPERQAETVANLRTHIIYILVTAIAVGVAFSHMLARSMGARVDELLQAMRRVQRGDFSQRVKPIGTDEIDILARQFNAMVQQLDQNDQTIRDLNVNLESKVKRRTRQLSKSKRSLQRSLRKLREYDQLKTEFFSNVSHELRTPLTMILSPVERILQVHGEQLSPSAVSLVDVIRINALRLLELINKLLDFSKLEAGRVRLDLRVCDLNVLIGELASAARPLAEQRGLRLELRVDSQIPEFGIDEDKIDTVLSNLISNALKFTPAGGVVRIETHRCGDQIRVDVIDSGIGIAPEDYERIFERFVQIDGSMSRSFSGTGLGLALAREFARLHGGDLGVESELGRGSRFFLILPLTVSAAGEAPVDAAPLRANRAERFADLVTCTVEEPQRLITEAPRAPEDAPVVLVADDTPEMRLLVGEILGDQYQIRFAGDGAEALEAIHRQPPDLIISDVMMPHVDGYELCRRVKEDPRTAQIPFVLLTAKAQISMRIEGLDRGADDYLVKPFDAQELKARVRSLLRLRQMHRELDRQNMELEATLADLRATQRQLVQSEKMNSLGQLVAGLAHEINNAINAVYNGIQPLNQRVQRLEGLVQSALSCAASGDAPPQGEIEQAFKRISLLAGAIESGAVRTARIVRDLKTFSHPGSEHSEWFDLHEALDVCVNLLAHELKHRVTISRDYQARPQFYGPSGQLNQVFMNILNNAQQAINGRGEIVIATRSVEDGVTVHFSDTGCGIPEEVRNRIFDPFFTTKAPGLGTGLGLSLSYGIITSLGGTIECRSQPGVGTEFILFLPESAGAPATGAPQTLSSVGTGSFVEGPLA